MRSGLVRRFQAKPTCFRVNVRVGHARRLQRRENAHDGMHVSDHPSQSTHLSLHEALAEENQYPLVGLLDAYMLACIPAWSSTVILL